MPDRQPEDPLEVRFRELRVPADAEDRTVEAVRRMLGSPTGPAARAEETTRQPTPAREGRRWAGSRRPVLALAILALGAGAAGALALTQPWERDKAPLVAASRSAAERIVADPLLSQLAWITQTRAADGGPARIQELAEAPSLRFPPGVSFQQAFDRIFASLASTGTLPAEASLGAPLPLGKVVALPSDPSQGIAIDLRAPRGYLIPSGILPTGFAAAPDWTPAEGERRIAEANREGLIVPLGAVIAPPTLEPCQILDPADPTPACTLSPPLG